MYRTPLTFSNRIFTKGFGLFEFSLVLIISSIIGLFLIQQSVRDSKKSLARIQADQIDQLTKAVNSYVDLYRRELALVGSLAVDVNGDGTPEITLPENPPAGTGEGGKRSPTIAQLITAGFLTGTFSNTPVASTGQFIVRLSKQPSTCDPSADNCRIEGYVAINQPVQTSSASFIGNLYDGDVVGDMLGFMGGNGFATFLNAQPAVSAGGNFTVALDLNGDSTADPQIPSGIVGMRVGATATRVDVRDPIAGVDFCAGNRLLIWPVGNTGINGVPAPIQPDPEPTSIPTSFCGVRILSDTPVGYRFVQTDADTGGNSGGTNGNAGGGNDPGGSILLRCVFDETQNPPARFVALSSCCQQGNSQCTPPAPGS
jgi:competence protein ComGC